LADRQGERREGQQRRKGRHVDRAQPVAARLAQGLPRRHGMRQLGIFGDVENCHLGADADHHCHAHQSRDVEIDAGEPETGKDGGRREQLTAKNDDRQPESFVEEEQQDEFGDQRCDEDLRQPIESDLLLLVRARDAKYAGRGTTSAGESRSSTTSDLDEP
jgi:hypothetical protein